MPGVKDGKTAFARREHEPDHWPAGLQAGVDVPLPELPHGRKTPILGPISLTFRIRPYVAGEPLPGLTPPPLLGRGLTAQPEER